MEADTDQEEVLCDLRIRITHFKRIPATHIFVLMISSDTRDKKPYALPVQWFPYAGLKKTGLFLIYVARWFHWE